MKNKEIDVHNIIEIHNNGINIILEIFYNNLTFCLNVEYPLEYCQSHSNKLWIWNKCYVVCKTLHNTI